eukprot:7872938-Pyramimonas_sp.AAC.1
MLLKEPGWVLWVCHIAVRAASWSPRTLAEFPEDSPRCRPCSLMGGPTLGSFPEDSPRCHPPLWAL